MIELAIVIPMFILLLVAICDFGIYFNKRIVAQTAAFNDAKECNLTQGASLTQYSAGAKTLNTLMPIEDFLTTIDRTCTEKDTSFGGTTYWEVQMTVAGNELSFTNILNLYPFTVTGIETRTIFP